MDISKTRTPMPTPLLHLLDSFYGLGKGGRPSLLHKEMKLVLSALTDKLCYTQHSSLLILEELLLDTGIDKTFFILTWPYCIFDLELSL